MSGHSKWSTIKHKKGAADAKRGQLFSKLNKEITVAAKLGGGDSDNNPRLRTAVSKAKEANMPADNIERAVKKGTGELEGTNYEDITYEGYAKGGVAVLVEALTDNKNRTTPEIRNLFTKKDGNMAGAGSVAWMFEKKGLITVNKKETSEDILFSLVLDNGGDDLTLAGDFFEITTSIEAFDEVRKAVEQNNVKYENAEITLLPKNSVKITDKAIAAKVLDLVESLEDHDDVQNVYANFDIPDEILEEQ